RFFFFSSRRRHTRSYGDWSSDVCSSDLETAREIRATFIIDLGILRSYGREVTTTGQDKKPLGLNRQQKELLLALALWKVRQLLRSEERRVGKEGRARRAEEHAIQRSKVR